MNALCDKSGRKRNFKSEVKTGYLSSPSNCILFVTTLEGKFDQNLKKEDLLKLKDQFVHHITYFRQLNRKKKNKKGHYNQP